MNCASGDSSSALALFKAGDTSFTPAGSGKGVGGGDDDTAIRGDNGCETLFTPAGCGKGGGGGDDASSTAATYHNSLR